MKSYDKRSTDRLSNPKGDFCNKRYCYCNKQHEEKSMERITRSATKHKIKPRMPKLAPLKPMNNRGGNEEPKEPS
jgi:hypothetical protein